ncbi:hypothetical protein [uncultured Chitinophaga sp.]|jgi:hypothetical protein|uniref:hypothetical protein n=1 Tax=uncultured Chitinophaga sp. TaxID=339340 RepID=UPI0026099A20|nr:hypothetical protein [uncultured Chitinophaga sp.]
MKKLQQPEPHPENFLNLVYLKLSDVPIGFRERVSEECNYSTPTFYRKMRSSKSLSNAEKEKIVCVVDEFIADLKNFIEPYRKRSA